jgi:hypothetical protein
MIRDNFRFHTRGEIVEVLVVSATNEEWAASPQSGDDAYSVLRLTNGRVRACKITLPPEILRQGAWNTHDWLAELRACPPLEITRPHLRRRLHPMDTPTPAGPIPVPLSFRIQAGSIAFDGQRHTAFVDVQVHTLDAWRTLGYDVSDNNGPRKMPGPEWSARLSDDGNTVAAVRVQWSDLEPDPYPNEIPDPIGTAALRRIRRRVLDLLEDDPNLHSISVYLEANGEARVNLIPAQGDEVEITFKSAD